MARPYRLQGENLFYHITSRGDGKKKIYISEYDYSKFLEYVLKAKERCKFRLYAYVLMPNHFHLLVETLKPNISQVMHYIKSSYTTYYNMKRKAVGHLFQGRFKSIIVDKDDYFLTLTRYIHLNPVKAKIVQFPEEYEWSSYKAYLNHIRYDKYIDKPEIKEILNNISPSQYRQFVLDGIGKEEDPFKNLYAGFMLGSTKFIKERLKDLKEQIENKEVSYRDSLKEDISHEAIIGLVAERYGKSRGYVLKSKARPMKEKKIAIYLMRRLTPLTNIQIGEIFDMNFSAVSKAAHSMEKIMEENSIVKKEVWKLVSSFEV